MKIKILGIWHNTHKKDGTQYLTKDGRPYERCVIKDEKGYIYGYGSKTTKEWLQGDEVDIQITEQDGYRHFKLFPQTVTMQEFNALRARVEALEKRMQKFNGKEAPNDINDVLDEAIPNDDPPF